MSSEQRREVHFSGDVQGVGFRYTTRDIARRYAVVGFVRNLPNGRVQLIVEGQLSDVDAFTSEVGATMASYIRNAATTNPPPTGEFAEFSIRF